MIYTGYLHHNKNEIPYMTFAEAKSYFEAAFLDYYGQQNQTIDQTTTIYHNGAWIFNSPVWSSDGKTVTSYGKFRDHKEEQYQPFGAQFDTESNNPPIYPG